MLYLTFNDAPSGIYFSQVTDVCRFLERETKQSVKLLALISIRSFSENKRKIKEQFPASLVLPMFPRARNWKLNIFWLFLLTLFRREKLIIARGPFAAGLALNLRKLGCVRKVCFDARGAYTAELREYEVVQDERVKKEISNLEARVLQYSDFRLAVSEALVTYWRREFAYQGRAHVVIPCTLGSGFLRPLPDPEHRTKTREALGFSESDLVLTYSGSSAGWQSFSLVTEFLQGLMRTDERVKILFLAKELPAELLVEPVFAGRVVSQWVKPSLVPDLLAACDYGLILREASVTNRVASPVKFAEYLSAGLPVLISEDIGDYSGFVEAHKCGRVIKSGKERMRLEKLSLSERLQIHSLAEGCFSKEAYVEHYKRILACE